MTAPGWWASLKQGGLFIAPARLVEHFPEAPEALPSWLADRLRRDITRLDSGGDAERALLDTALEKVCGLDEADGGPWRRGADVPAEWSHRALTGESIRPRRLWQGPRGARLPVFVDGEARLGVGRGRRAVARVLEWLRGKEQPLALLTNGRQWRLLYAGLDHEAWVEWDTDLWFEEGRPGAQVDALRVLLSPRALTPPRRADLPPLLAAILDSRRGQAELSAVLGERVRLAVEILIQSHAPVLGTLEGRVTTRDVYRAATRVIMRMIVIFFAEARDLLPRDNPLYHASYGLEGLRDALDRVGGGAGAERLRHRYSAWPRVLALFRLVFAGSHHPSLPVPRYGGGLFQSGAATAEDPVLRALTAFEDPEHAPDDATVRSMIELLSKSRVKVRQGATSVWVEAPVDFSDLSSEYIGILYEGLLDYELRRAPAADPYVFLALGDEPALPLSRLEGMDETDLGNLVEKARQKRRAAVASEEESDGDEESEEEGDENETGGEADASTPEAGVREAQGDDAPGDDERQRTRERAHASARRAVLAAGLVPTPRGRNAQARQQHEAAVEEAARRLIARVVLPGEWFLVRWGGTRKGAGTFYTRPQLAVPTVHRTLRPLAWETSPSMPKPPEQILALKVCDPAMGSGSFLVASLRFLTDALYASLFHHRWLAREEGRLTVVAGDGDRPPWFVEVVRDMPVDAEDAERYLRARLKRHVVERSIYGVDLDPLAVELGKLALWIETMDRTLPFGFLDHNLKVGNSLVGCWFDRFRDYPPLAWEREGGDANHDRFVHHVREEAVKRGKDRGTVRRTGDVWTQAIKDFRARLKPALADWVAGQGSLFDKVEGRSPEALHDEAVALFEQLHALPIHDSDGRAAFYREKVLGSPALTRLKEAFDTWCAVWFWPADRLDLAPLPATMEQLTDEARAVVRTLQAEHGFFHWELEFPDVFAAPGGGFHAIVGNPPWEIQKPNSKEFFSNLDPLYRTYGKQEALRRQQEYFARSAGDERAWLQYCARFKALSNWNKHSASPFGGGADGGKQFYLGARSGDLQKTWAMRRAGRRGYADPEHPFRHQGSADINTYKMFLEVAHALLANEGYLGVIAPSGVYTDKGSADLRALFLTRCRWHWLFGFENREHVFDIDTRFKFGPVIVQKGGATAEIRTAFMRRRLRDWEEAERYAVPYTRARVERFSPRTRAILEIRGARDLETLEKIYANSVLLGDAGPDGWGIRYAREFDMTNDSKLFPPRPWWEERGYVPDVYGRWVKFRRKEPDGLRAATEAGWIRLADGSGVVHESDIEDVALPLYEGRMIGQFDFSQKGWVSGKGRRAVWREIPWDAKTIEPQFLMSGTTYETAADQAENLRAVRGVKFGFMDVSSATNSRSMIASLVPDCPCGNKVPVLGMAENRVAQLCAIGNSLVYDYQLRNRFGGLSLNYFIVEETAVPRAVEGNAAPVAQLIDALALRLGAAHARYAAAWYARTRLLGGLGWRCLWAVTPHERLRLRCLLDAVVAELYRLDWEDLAWILRECDYPVETLRDDAFTRTLDPKGFWRVDQNRDPELRHTVLTLAAFRDLKAVVGAHGGDRARGIDAFCAQNHGDGWLLPEAVCLSDLGLGHDERAKKPQAVRERLGERFFPWQLEQAVDESWAECKRHARNLLGEDAFARLEAELRGEPLRVAEPMLLKVAEEPQVPYAPEGPTQRRLFPGEPTLFGDRLEDPGTKRRKRRR